MVTLYGVPRTLKRVAIWAWTSPLFDVLWVTLVSLVLVAIAYWFFLISPFLGGFFASVVLAALWKDETRSLIRDVMLRRWATV